MRKRIISLWVCCLLVTVFPRVMRAGGDAEAKAILDRTSTILKKGGLKATFELVPHRQGIPQAGVQGEICVSGDKFKLITDDIITWFDGRTQWSYLTENEEVNISHPGREELQGINPLWLISLYEKGYYYALGKTTSSTQEVTLTAEQTDLPIAHLILVIDKSTSLPVTIRLKEEGRDYTVITIGNLQLGMKWGKDFFVFDNKQYPDAEVIDLR